MKLPKVDWKVVHACVAFGTSLIAVEAIHAVHIVQLINYPREMMRTFNSIPIAFSSNIQVILALLTCNNLVVVTYLYRVWRNRNCHDGRDNPNALLTQASLQATTPTSCLENRGNLQ
ncbi:hypothetical protein FA15DRAFT_676638 [Coprinopsis marcescibilis]|uniref:Uncharacterized protein n=1 Tax=Coprinopsis marcescibilis TaxID=230819 RepID=A0A5C3K9I2_COPMA|nr:hypothetical protein FA15DRAFT_676638 [Coprinopsis marcescibilis]